jgi:hypothetical protein
MSQQQAASNGKNFSGYWKSFQRKDFCRKLEREKSGPHMERMGDIAGIRGIK